MIINDLRKIRTVRTVFPIIGFTRARVRAHARDRKLGTGKTVLTVLIFHKPLAMKELNAGQFDFELS